MNEELKPVYSILDVGCGTNSHLRILKNANHYKVGVDIYKPSILKSRKQNIHDNYIQMNVNELESTIRDKSFDCVIAFDLIEHLETDDGLRLIKAMEKVALSKVILLTPNGFIPQTKYEGNQYQVHLSGWETDEMIKMGYRVIGINGWKKMYKVKNEMAEIRWFPKFFWHKIAMLSHLITKHYPHHAFQLLCIKEL
ncbi:class I SAM-dependent methyltransferase [candidate division KSB1 bacterium]|nr:class I SAM-dependent methyltransferase [candidate division KSB1 bacterium]